MVMGNDPDEHVPRRAQAGGLMGELEQALAPLERRIASLLARYPSLRGDERELARLLSASTGEWINQERVSHAIENIRAALEALRHRRGVPGCP